MVLPLRMSRWTNVVTASLMGLLVIVSAPGDLDAYFHFGLMLIALIIIVWRAWSWDRTRS
jgi:hypothetical protein